MSPVLRTRSGIDTNRNPQPENAWHTQPELVKVSAETVS
jgi:hypothetical protein